MKRSTRRSYRAGLLLATFISASFAQAPADALNAGKTLLENRKPEAALMEFKKAMSAAPTEHDGYFYAAVASYRLGDLAAAEEYAKAALEKAPEAEKAKVREMIGVIGERQTFEKLEREGDEALASGLRAKAADRYERAYALFPKEGRPGLKAAALYADKLNKLIDAAVLWREVADKGDEMSQAEARSELSKRRMELDKLMWSEIYTAQTSRRKHEGMLLARLCRAFPDRFEPHVEMAGWSESHKKYEQAVKYLSRAIAVGAEARDIQFNQRVLIAVQGDDDPALRTLVEDAYGHEVLEKMRKVPVVSARGDPPESLALLREATEQGHVWAMCVMGNYCESSEMLDSQKGGYSNAVAWYSKAVERGFPYGMIKLGSLYYFGNGVSKDVGKAFSLFQKAADLGEPSAYGWLGDVEVRRENIEAAEVWWRKGVELRDTQSLGGLAELLRKKSRYQEAISLAEKFIYAGNSDWELACAWLEVGRSYRDAPYPLRSLEKARHGFEKAIELGSFDAKSELANLP